METLDYNLVASLEWSEREYEPWIDLPKVSIGTETNTV